MPRRPSGAPRSAAGAKKPVEGIIQVTRRGVGYMPWPGQPDKEDIELETRNLGGALNGDTVAVELSGLFPRPKGKVVRIVERAKTEFVCTIADGRAKPDDARFYGKAIEIGKTDIPSGQKVLVRLTKFDGTAAHGEVVERIGQAGQHRTEMNAIVLEHGFSTSFPPEAEREAQELERRHSEIIAEELPKRRDFRATTTFTIDPVDAKDFDDALSIKELGDGEYEIGIHIADVGHFVREGTAIEAEARKRGTSVYLVDSTIPMLPHALSTNICSLREGEERLAFAAIVRIGKDGTVRSREFAKTVIRSDKRFTYEEAQEILDGKAGVAHAGARNSAEGATPAKPFVKELNTLWALAQTLRKQREDAGAIDFGDNEVRFTLDEQGKPLSVTRKKRINTNLLIEEFMLLANREVATYISQLAKKVPEKNYVFLYRIHDLPKADRIEELATFVRAIGYEFGQKKKNLSARDIQKLLRQIEGKPESHLIRTATLRSMAKAIYSTKNIGHFGLSFEHYTHFTSPIRRYPDLLVHRILFSHLEGTPLTRREFGHLEKLCLAASEAEAKAVDAERDSIRYKLVEYMQPKVGQVFDAVISGVTDWGLYVEEKESSAEGLVRVRSIGNDFYNYVPKEYSLVGQRTKQKFSLGDRVRVKLVGADLGARTLDFELAP
jgi:ribonuclease R